MGIRSFERNKTEIKRKLDLLYKAYKEKQKTLKVKPQKEIKTKFTYF